MNKEDAQWKSDLSTVWQDDKWIENQDRKTYKFWGEVRLIQLTLCNSNYHRFNITKTKNSIIEEQHDFNEELNKLVKNIQKN